MKFKVGQIVCLRKHGSLSRDYGAKRGMKARVVKGLYRSQWDNSLMFKLLWLDKTTQGNGGYEIRDFEIVAEPNGQQLFNFMYEKV